VKQQAQAWWWQGSIVTWLSSCAVEECKYFAFVVPTRFDHTE
jgi:hypothetical protein